MGPTTKNTKLLAKNSLSLPQIFFLWEEAADNHPELGLHTGMPELKALFDQGKAAFIANVGSFVRPITLTEFKKQAWLPLGLFSHSDQVGQWMTAVPDHPIESGWGGRASDLLREKNTGTKVSMNISLAGNNVFQYGHHVVPYSVTPNGSIGFKSLDLAQGRHALRIRCRAQSARATLQEYLRASLHGYDLWSHRRSRSLLRRG